ncbi:cation-translocating P-type ATPase [Actinorugispora endophytica]|uniref:P-type E1-E2 ATPase n=1 Tax=Actinorugispora endophytica TaxID=1605990 RepID=A0A4R6UZQ4_9ACTN|nr:HAD-IC family P-type ATPase [Actinorugispora endophytica]TDQ53096.1 P-type E1-E2 ATPase [Actinorugispora endophytica]
MAHDAGADPGAGPPESARTGLTGAEAAERLRRDGPNALPPPRWPVPFTLLAGEFTRLFALLLWGAALLVLVGGLPRVAAVIAVVVVANGLLAFVLEYRAARAARHPRGVPPAAAAVVRDGRRAFVDAAELVVGDVVLLAAGDRVAADVRLASAHSLVLDESPPNGRSTTARLSDGATAHAGAYVVEGEAEGVVTATGARTRLGRTAARPREARRPAGPLTLDLRDLSALVAVAAAGVGVLFAVVATALGASAADSLLIGVGAAVALVPQGLLPAVTLSLTWTARRMARHGAPVRRPEAVERIGSVSFVCTGTTGPLTRGEMSVIEVWTPAGTVRVEGAVDSPGGGLAGGAPALAAVRAVAETAVLGSGAAFRSADHRWHPRGDPTEAALLALAARAGVDRSAPPVPRRHPFDPRRRRASAVAGGAVHVAGAPEAVLPLCGNSSAAAPALSGMTARGLRVLAVARRDAAPSSAPPDGADDAERDLTLLGLAALADPPRAGASAAVARFRRAGVRTALVTGDHPGTALAVAREAGLAADPPLVVTGAELPDDLRDLGELLDRDGVVVARATPEDRLRVTVALQHRGHVVATVCGGAHDGPALRRADIGVALGASGTDAAREAADLVLLDDHLQELVSAVELGRAALGNVRRLLTHHLVAGTAELAPFLVWALTGGAVPLALGVLQILALDLGTGLLTALALGAEPPDRRAMRGRTPAGATLIDRRLVARSLGVLGPLAAAVTVFAFVIALLTGGWTWGAVPGPALLAAASGAAFATVALGQAATALACRSETDPFDTVPWAGDPLLPAALGAGLLALPVFLLLPPLPGHLGGTAPPAISWPAILCVVPALLAADTIHKVVRHPPTAGA